MVENDQRPVFSQLVSPNSSGYLEENDFDKYMGGEPWAYSRSVYVYQSNLTWTKQ